MSTNYKSFDKNILCQDSITDRNDEHMNFVCTLPKGHGGYEHEHQEDGNILASWTSGTLSDLDDKYCGYDHVIETEEIIYRCTLPKGHSGFEHESSMNGNILSSWVKLPEHDEALTESISGLIENNHAKICQYSCKYCDDIAKNAAPFVGDRLITYDICDTDSIMISDGSHPINVLFSINDALDGIRMSRKLAKELGQKLIAASEYYVMQDEYLEEYDN